MCRFKYAILGYRCLGNIISIHLMCRFKLWVFGYFYSGLSFQYILCVGSRLLLWEDYNGTDISIHLMCRFKFNFKCIAHWLKHFNTSYVSVQAKRWERRCGAKGISIHLMCRFKKRVSKKKRSKLLISIHLMCRFKAQNRLQAVRASRAFQYILCVGSSITIWHFVSSSLNFNTSYVSVQAKSVAKMKVAFDNFNTSYVSVQANGIRRSA